MDSQQEPILIDTNIFVIDLRYKRDVHYKDNLAFLNLMAENGNGFTTIVNLLELCGILSFNLNEKQLNELWFYFQKRYKLTVLPAPDIASNFPTTRIGEILKLITKKLSLGDALMMAVSRKNLAFLSTMITWDKDYLEGKFPGNVLTPNEYLMSR